MIASTGARRRSPRSPRGHEAMSKLPLPSPRQSHARSRTSPNTALLPEPNARVEVLSGDLAKLFDELANMRLQLHHLRSGQQELYKSLQDLPSVRRNRLRHKRMSETPLGVLAKKRVAKSQRTTPRGRHKEGAIPRESGVSPAEAQRAAGASSSNPFASLPLSAPSREGTPSESRRKLSGTLGAVESDSSENNEGLMVPIVPKHRGHSPTNQTAIELTTVPPTPDRRDSNSDPPQGDTREGPAKTNPFLESYGYVGEAVGLPESPTLRLSFLGASVEGAPPLERRETDKFRAALTKEKNRKEHERHAPYGASYEEDFLQSLFWLKRWRQRGYFIFHDENYSTLAFFVLMGVLALIFVSTLAYVLETVQALTKYTEVWYGIELVVTTLFTIEYVLRLIIVKNRLRYMIRPMNVVDLLAILPFYLELLFPDMPTQTLRVLRVIRLARIARLRNLFSEYIEVMTNALKNAMDEAGPMMSLMLIVETVLFGSVVYAFENGHHTDSDGEETGFVSIPDTMWWAFVTITTVGYGDMSPVTPIGRFFGILCMFSGIVLMSIVVIIIGGNFEQAHQDYLDEKQSYKDDANEEGTPDGEAKKESSN